MAVLVESETSAEFAFFFKKELSESLEKPLKSPFSLHVAGTSLWLFWRKGQLQLCESREQRADGKNG